MCFNPSNNKLSSKRILRLQCVITSPARPPVATIVAEEPNSVSIRSISPSSIAAAPNIMPDFKQSTVLLPIAAFGASIPTMGSCAVFLVSASKVRGLIYKLLAKEFTEDGEYFIDSNFDEICQKLMEVLPPTSLEYIMSPEVEARLCRALNYGEERWK